MKREIVSSIFAVTAAVTLVACAAKRPANPQGVTMTSTAADAQDPTSAEYQSLVDNARNQMVCRRQSVTGSRIDQQICMTRAQMEEQRKRAEEVVRDIQSSAAMTRQSIPDRPPMPTSMPRTNP